VLQLKRAPSCFLPGVPDSGALSGGSAGKGEQQKTFTRCERLVVVYVCTQATQEQSATNMKTPNQMLSLFTGAGGLDLGLEAAGFSSCACIEIDPEARKTAGDNRPDWRFVEPHDIGAIEARDLPSVLGIPKGDLALVAGGPPCQPFSKSGYWANGDTRRLLDPRASTLGYFFAAVESTLPRFFILENVQGLGYRNKAEGLTQILESVEAINTTAGTSYRPSVLNLNAADFGVPQLRHRVFVVAHRDGVELQSPAPTHAGLTEGLRDVAPHLTAWDAIGDLDSETWDSELTPRGKWAGLLPSIPEGSNYLWHTSRGGGQEIFGWRTRYWSFLLKLAKSQPSWTIQACPGPATGPFHWRNRLLSIQELLRLQTFPQGFCVGGPWGAAVRQIGNAVPPLLSEVLGRSMLAQVFPECQDGRRLVHAIDTRDGCPDPYPVQPVPEEFMQLVAERRPHPGVGLGPGALARAAKDA